MLLPSNFRSALEELRLNTKNTLAATAVLAFGILATQAAESSVGIKNVVLVHGGFVDGSGWSQQSANGAA